MHSYLVLNQKTMADIILSDLRRFKKLFPYFVGLPHLFSEIVNFIKGGLEEVLDAGLQRKVSSFIFPQSAYCTKIN